MPWLAEMLQQRRVVVVIERQRLGRGQVEERERVGRSFVGLEPECKRLRKTLVSYSFN